MQQVWNWSLGSLIASLVGLVGFAAVAQPMTQPKTLEVDPVSQPKSASERNASPQPVAQTLLTPRPITQLVAQQNEVLTRAEVYKLRNQVELVPFNQTARTAKLSDILVPQDALRTSTDAIAELLFNEGSIARVDASTVFRFREGLRRFQLPNRISQQPQPITADQLAQLEQISPEYLAAAVKLVQRQPVAQTSTDLVQADIVQADLVQAVVQKETIFVLESGTALLMSPPNSVSTRVETSESQISIIAPKTTTGQIASLNEAASFLLPPDRSSAVMVVHDPQANRTRVFALTDGDIRVFNRSGTSSIALIGGQTVAVTNGQLGPVETFDLEAFYRTVPLAAGLGPNQAALVLEEPAPVQVTLNAIRVETLAALRRQVREISTFTGTFLRDALNGNDTDFDGQRGRRTELIIGGRRQTGTFVRTEGEDSDSIVTGTFTPDDATPDDATPDGENPNANSDVVRFRVNIDTRDGTIDGQRGRSSDAGFSGNNAVGTVRFERGRVWRIEVFDVNGDAPDDRPEGYRGRLIRDGLQPDR